MKYKIITVLLLGMLVISNAISADQIYFAPTNPDFVNKNSRQSQFAVNEGENRFGLRPSPHDPAIRKFLPSTFLLKNNYGALPSSYDLRAQNKVTSVKDQGAYGNCWAFASIASMESCLLPGETNDFSENHLSNLHGFDSAFGEGGNCYMSMAYFARWAGPVNESEDPYPNPSGSPSGLAPRKHLQEAIFVPDKTSISSLNVLKQAIMTYGAYYTVMRWEDTAYNASTYAFYNPSSNYPNHAVTIVGWDDNFDKNKFTTTPPGNGAFLIKNSWSTSWGNGGYFWISYYDHWVGTENCIFNDAETTNNYKTVYEYDELGWCTSIGFGNNTAWGANIFQPSSGTATIYAVSFYTIVPDTECLIKIYNNVSSNNPSNGTLLLIATNTYSFAGYHTFTLPISLNVSGRFSVVIRFTTPSYTYPVAIEYPFSGYSSGATALPGESFISASEASWIDCGAQSPAYNVCIKAFGTGTAPTPTPPEPTVSYMPLLNDFDGDLYGDPALYCDAQGKLYILPSSYNFSKVFTLSGWGGIGYSALAGIFDDDWPEDPILYYPNSGMWYFLSSQSGYGSIYYTQWGDSAWHPVAADFNGDWYVDPTVYQNGWWYVLLSEGSPITQGYNHYVSGYFNVDGGYPFGGDVDGDGLADLILHQPATGKWYALLSSSVYSQYVSATWGGTDVSACVGDFDGDLKADAAVFNNTSGLWKVLLSSSGYTREASGIWKP